MIAQVLRSLSLMMETQIEFQVLGQSGCCNYLGNEPANGVYICVCLSLPPSLSPSFSLSHACACAFSLSAFQIGEI